MSDRQRIAVVTGSRADFGLLSPVMRAIELQESLELQVVIAGAHLLPPEQTRRDVAAQWEIAATVEMQRPEDAERFADSGRLADALGTGRGMCNMTAALASLTPHWVVVLGDRIEAFAAAATGSIAGVPVAHIHGGDRAEGVGDEAMRHAITKLAHLHLPATAESAKRVARLGEPRDRIEIVGSPAIDGLDEIEPTCFSAEEPPHVVVLYHPIGDDGETEHERAQRIVEAVSDQRAVFCKPNRDAGRSGVRDAFQRAPGGMLPHLPRPQFLGLLKALAEAGGVLVGNSSAGLIEAAALGLGVVDIGERQSGRERGANVVHTDGESIASIRQALQRARSIDRAAMAHPYGDGRAGERIAAALAARDMRSDDARRRMVRKHNAH